MEAQVRVKNIGLSSGFHKTIKPEQTAISVCPVPVYCQQRHVLTYRIVRKPLPLLSAIPLTRIFREGKLPQLLLRGRELCAAADYLHDFTVTRKLAVEQLVLRVNNRLFRPWPASFAHSVTTSQPESATARKYRRRAPWPQSLYRPR